MINSLGIVLDGNRRFAQYLMKKPWEGHRLGLDKAREAIGWACKYGIKYTTAYVLSYENLKTRPKLELEYIFKYFKQEAETILDDENHVINKMKVKVKFIGRVHELPQELQSILNKVEDKTKDNKDFVLNVAIAYGGQQEIADAVKDIAKKVLDGILSPAQLDETVIKEHLYTNGQPYPDLIIRTGGDHRLSNFLPYQSVYSELIFIDKKWPEMEEKDFLDALNEYENRQRRFGY